MSLLVQIEHCKNCHLHSWCSRHDQIKYIDFYEQLCRKIQIEMPGVRVIERKLPEYLELRKSIVSEQQQYLNKQSGQHEMFPRSGAFQIYADTYRIFSKIKSKKWPKFDRIIQKLRKFLEAKKNGDSLQVFDVDYISDEELILNQKTNQDNYNIKNIFRVRNNKNDREYLSRTIDDHGHHNLRYDEFTRPNPQKNASFGDKYKSIDRNRPYLEKMIMKAPPKSMQIYLQDIYPRAGIALEHKRKQLLLIRNSEEGSIILENENGDKQIYRKQTSQSRNRRRKLTPLDSQKPNSGKSNNEDVQLADQLINEYGKRPSQKFAAYREQRMIAKKNQKAELKDDKLKQQQKQEQYGENFQEKQDKYQREERQQKEEKQQKAENQQKLDQNLPQNNDQTQKINSLQQHQENSYDDSRVQQTEKNNEKISQISQRQQQEDIQIEQQSDKQEQNIDDKKQDPQNLIMNNQSSEHEKMQEQNNLGNNEQDNQQKHQFKVIDEAEQIIMLDDEHSQNNKQQQIQQYKEENVEDAVEQTTMTFDCFWNAKYMGKQYHIIQQLHDHPEVRINQQQQKNIFVKQQVALQSHQIQNKDSNITEHKFENKQKQIQNQQIIEKQESKLDVNKQQNKEQGKNNHIKNTQTPINETTSQLQNDSRKLPQFNLEVDKLECIQWETSIQNNQCVVYSNGVHGASDHLETQKQQSYMGTDKLIQKQRNLGENQLQWDAFYENRTYRLVRT